MKNNIGLLVGLLGPLLGTFVFMVILTHGLSQEDFNFFIYVYTLSLLFNVLSDFGLRGKLYLEVKKKDGDCVQLYSEVVFYRLIMWCVSILLFLLTSYLVFNTINTTILILSLYTGLNYVSDLNVSFFRGLAASVHETKLNIIEKTFFILFLVAVYLSGGPPEAYAVALVVSAMIRLAVGSRILHHQFSIRWDSQLVNYQVFISRLKQSFEVGLATFVQVFILRWSLIVLPLLGLYVIAGQVGVLLSLLQAFLIIPTYLSIKYFMGGEIKSYTLPLSICLVLGLALSVILFLLLPMLNLLFNGVLENHVELTKYMFLMLPFLLANQFLRHYFIAKGKSVSLYNLLGVLFLLLGIIFIYVCGGDANLFGLYVFLLELGLFVMGGVLSYAK